MESWWLKPSTQLKNQMLVKLKRFHWLVVSTHLKNISQIGSFLQVGVKIKNIWNHHVDHLFNSGCFTLKKNLNISGVHFTNPPMSWVISSSGTEQEDTSRAFHSPNFLGVQSTLDIQNPPNTW